MNKKTLVIIFLDVFLAILLLGIVDVINLDNKLYSWINILLGRGDFTYFDFPFIQTTLSLFEIAALFSAVFTSFFILREEQKDSKKRTQLSNQPFLRTLSNITFHPYDDEIGTTVYNLGLGPALFIRISFVEFSPDNPENATLQYDQPHGEYLGSKEESSELIFDQRHFYKFITRTERGGELGSDRMNYNDRALRKELGDLIKAKVDQDFFIYIHSSDILGKQMIFKVKYLLCMKQYSPDEFILKRMEIEQINI